ncbi:DUF6702 family protein [Bacteroidota bacterium]
MCTYYKHNRLIVFGFLVCAIAFSASHKFYVSLTEVHIRKDKGSIEISMRIFPDDLDRALKTIHGVNPQIATELEHKNADEWVSEYIKAHFDIEINEQPIAIAYLGKEQESDAIWCYLEAELPAVFSEITVKSSFLIDEFKDQKNIVQVYYGEFNKGLLLDAYNTEGSLELNEEK